MTLPMFVLFLAFIPLAAFLLIVNVLPERKDDELFDWIQERFQ